MGGGQAGRFISDEVSRSTLPGRLNSNGVDLNRNWDCNWQPTAIWYNRQVNPGDAPFSEIETQLLRDFLTDPPANGVIFLHSAAQSILAGSCGERYPPSDELADIYAKGSGYPFKEHFTAYPVTGSAVDWLAQVGIPAIEVELTNHQELDWKQNLGGILITLEILSK